MELDEAVNIKGHSILKVHPQYALLTVLCKVQTRTMTKKLKVCNFITVMDMTAVTSGLTKRQVSHLIFQPLRDV